MSRLPRVSRRASTSIYVNQEEEDLEDSDLILPSIASKVADSKLKSKNQTRGAPRKGNTTGGIKKKKPVAVAQNRSQNLLGSFLLSSSSHFIYHI